MPLSRLLVALVALFAPYVAGQNSTARGVSAALASEPQATAPDSQPAAAAPRVEVRFSREVHDQPFTGRVFLMTTQRGGRPMNGPSWFGTEPFYALDVKDWKPDTPLLFNPEECLGFPGSLRELKHGRYLVQAVMDMGGWSHRAVNGPGNLYCEPAEMEHLPERPADLKLTIDKKRTESKPTERDGIKVVSIRSRLLSEFHKRDVELHAVVGLPGAYAREPERRFPALYVIPGFGGGFSAGARMVNPKPYEAAGIDLVVIYLDPDCPTGHHVFADSANNGPTGQALIEELIPHLEKEFRLIADADARYLTGHSSGGWSSLWLQVTYPDSFGGVWSTSPDPVDFSAFQTINIYDSSENFFTMPDGSPRPIARSRGRSGIRCKDFSDMEVVLGRGGQLQSFEAVFSPRGADGKPRPLWDRKTGKLDPQTADAWKKYDIRMILENNWTTLGPKLQGKLYLFCGDQDTFYLEKAFVKLRDALKRLGSDAIVEFREGEDHGLSAEVFRDTIPRQIARQFRERYESKRR